MNLLKKFLSLLLGIAMTALLFAMPMSAQAASLSSKGGVVNITSGRLNVRNSPSTEGALLTTLKKGAHITLMSQSGNWWKVEYAKGKYGYTHRDYIQTIPAVAKTVSLSSGSLNVRSGAGTSYTRIGALSNNEIVLELSKTEEWSRILYHGSKIGYVSNRYLREGYSAVSLAVPYYKQTDSRWAKTILGSSGKTIAQIGCATTGIAMMESYRTGKSVTPDKMANSLKYTTSGSVYWPSHFTAETQKTDYLTKLYTKLKQNKPVLFGAKTNAGKQHWVVVRGFKGGALTTANFTILDPGSGTRTTLQQFLSAYPNFYKYFYYT